MQQHRRSQISFYEQLSEQSTSSLHAIDALYSNSKQDPIRNAALTTIQLTSASEWETPLNTIKLYNQTQAKGCKDDIVEVFFAQSAKATGASGNAGSGTGTWTPPRYTTGGDSKNFNIDLIFQGDGWNQGFYDQAVAMFNLVSCLVVGDISDFSSSYRKGRNIVKEFIDDIQITLTLKSIDGAGGTLGQAGPNQIRTSNELPLKAFIELDTADAQSFFNNNLFDDILLHEGFHCLGFGSLWDYGLNPLSNGNFTYTGPEGTRAYRLSGFAGDPLIENNGGGGTAGAHWEEGDDGRQTMNPSGLAPGTELLTGYLNAASWLSWTTVASLEDLGYETLWDGTTAQSRGTINGIALADITPTSSILAF